MCFPRAILSSFYLVSFVFSLPSLAAQPQPAPNKPTGDELTPAQRLAVDHGLACLAAQQKNDGSFSAPGITALCGVAFMSAGNLPNRGRYGQQVQKCLDSVLANAQESGLIAAGQVGGPPMYGHGFATLFLAEVYGMTPDDSVKERLAKAVSLIQRTQNQEGGWRYQPIPFDADISVTICQVMALRAARDAGVKVNKTTIDRAIQYVRRCQNGDGGFSYMPGSGGSGFARTAAGVATLYYAGVFEGNDLNRGLKYLNQLNPAAGDESFYFYGHYYAAQAMFLAGGEYWQHYYPAIRDQLVQRQDKASGAWSGGEAGADYGTAMALIVLQMPNRYLPVFHGKGPGA
ncbi:MAG: prenyltransferase/squalene oxidase repeat-containing protein [Tepidisphaeraceae bacterium]